MTLKLILAYAVSVVLLPVTATAITLGIAKAAGRLERWYDEGGRLSWVFSVRFAERRSEFFVALARSLAAVGVARVVFVFFQVPFGWPVVLIIVVALAVRDIWWLQFHHRHWRLATTRGIESWNLDEAAARQAFASSEEAAAFAQRTMRATLCGDVAGATLGGLFALF